MKIFSVKKENRKTSGLCSKLPARVNRQFHHKRYFQQKRNFWKERGEKNTHIIICNLKAHFCSIAFPFDGKRCSNYLKRYRCANEWTIISCRGDFLDVCLVYTEQNAESTHTHTKSPSTVQFRSLLTLFLWLNWIFTRKKGINCITRTSFSATYVVKLIIICFFPHCCCYFSFNKETLHQ